MKWIFVLLIAASFIFGIGTGRLEQVSKSALERGSEAITFFLYLLGSMCVWGGVMKVAEKSGIMTMFGKLFKPVGKTLFKGLNLGGKAFSAICMNVAANLLGLGNAATPLGLAAMKNLENEHGKKHMSTFVVLNTASITLIPTTVAAIRLNHGAQNPLDILPMVLINSVIAVSVALTLNMICIKFLSRYERSNILDK